MGNPPGGGDRIITKALGARQRKAAGADAIDSEGNIYATLAFIFMNLTPP
jgi:hypothetical protein